MTAQNIYDDPVFFAGYEKLRRTASGLNEAIEQPSFMRLLPQSIKGARVLDLGCGFGDFARKVRLLGARAVVGIDPSSRMLEVARARTDDPAIEYRQDAIETLQPMEEPFDLVVASLVLHYVSDYEAALRRIAKLMKPGSRLAFSVEHPICTALPEQKWCCDSNGTPSHWPVDRYQDEGERQTVWFVDGVTKYHRTVETYVNGLLSTGFRIVRLEEPAPLPEAVLAQPRLRAHLRRPPLLLLAANLETAFAA
jgi:ubiquinone/menaquinone biosynthesis C-methylase UbiE